MKHGTETSTASQAPQSQFSLLTDGRQSKHLIEREDKEDEQQSQATSRLMNSAMRAKHVRH